MLSKLIKFGCEKPLFSTFTNGAGLINVSEFFLSSCLFVFNGGKIDKKVVPCLLLGVGVLSFLSFYSFSVTGGS